MSLSIPGTGAMDLPSDSTVATNPATGNRSTKIATMQKFADEFAATLSGNGYQKFPTGLIIQWGTKTVAAGNNTVTLPTPFGTSIFCMVATQASPHGGGLTTNNIVTTSLIDLATVNIACNVPGGVFWVAIGI